MSTAKSAVQVLYKAIKKTKQRQYKHQTQQNKRLKFSSLLGQTLKPDVKVLLQRHFKSMQSRVRADGER